MTRYVLVAAGLILLVAGGASAQALVTEPADQVLVVQVPAAAEGGEGRDSDDQVLVVLSDGDESADSSTEETAATSGESAAEPVAFTGDFPGLTAEEQQAFKEGLAIWRKPDARGMSCAGCHGPGVDLAFLDVSEDDLHRRDEPHITREESEKVVEYVRLQRKRLGITELEDPATFRPFQTGGEVLPGETAQERDMAFAEELQAVIPTLMTGTVDSLEKAERARQELRDIDIRNLKVGIPFPKWVNDPVHDTEPGQISDHEANGGGIHEWMAHLPCEPRSEEARQEYHGLQDVYLNDPSRENFWAMYERSWDLTVCGDPQFNGSEGEDRPDWRAAKFERSRHHAVLVAQHALLEQAQGNDIYDPENGFMRGQKTFADLDLDRKDPMRKLVPGFGSKGNPVWAMAEMSRKPGRAKGPAGESLRVQLDYMGYPDFVVESVPEDATRDDEYVVLGMRSWSWMHVVFDNELFVGYFLEPLYHSDYHIHSAFRAAYEVEMKNYHHGNNRLYGRFTGAMTSKHDHVADEHKDMYNRFTTNIALMGLYLAEDDILNVTTDRIFPNASNGGLYRRLQALETLQGMGYLSEQQLAEARSMHDTVCTAIEQREPDDLRNINACRGTGKRHHGG